MDLKPRHRLLLALPGPWPACAQGLLREGAAWLHTGQARPGDPGGDLLVLPGGPVLDSRWEAGAWTTALDGATLAGSPWEALASVLGQGPWVGAATFELACWEAGLPFQDPGTGALGMRWQAARVAIRVQEGRAELWSWDPAAPDPAPVLARLGSACALARASGALSPRWGPDRHRAAVEAIQRGIHDGAFYVANLCVPFEGPFEGDAVTLALSALRRARPPYGAFLDLGGPRLLCLSMERLLARRGERLWTEPIKGSAPLAGDPATDAAAGATLRADPKERAEHSMIVDLLRNDLGRAAAVGTVAVERLMELEPYPTVQHLVSRVAARARPGLTLPDLLRAMLPGGSVTGAPKRAVCAHLAGAEAGPRGFYCGALGWIGADGDLDLSLPIRTARIDGPRLTYWAGGGITRLSDPAKEWEELLLKTRALTQAL
ncbi:MAG TPA: anthranilate synthase component I family protein [Holophagaceae bacterium]|nr:anthranilate synthase component I family protein [Holophagaceae bacterium]